MTSSESGTPSLYARTQAFFNQGHMLCTESRIVWEKELVDTLSPLTKQQIDSIITPLGNEYAKVIYNYFDARGNPLFALTSYPHFLALMEQIKALSPQEKRDLCNKIDISFPKKQFNSGSDFPWVQYVSSLITSITSYNLSTALSGDQ